MVVSSQYGNLLRRFPFGCQLRGGQRRSGFGENQRYEAYMGFTASYRKRQGTGN